MCCCMLLGYAIKTVKTTLGTVYIFLWDVYYNTYTVQALVQKWNNKKIKKRVQIMTEEMTMIGRVRENTENFVDLKPGTIS